MCVHVIAKQWTYLRVVRVVTDDRCFDLRQDLGLDIRCLQYLNVHNLLFDELFLFHKD
jgi:hypothetical protein